MGQNGLHCSAMGTIDLNDLSVFVAVAETMSFSKGAARLGMPTIAFNYDNQARADLYLRQFDELAAILKTWPLGG